MSTSISATEIGLPDNAKLKLGTGEDLEIYHDGTNTYLDNNTGQFNIDAASGNAIRFLVNGSYQCQVYTSGIDLPDNKKLRLGDSEDLEIYHDGTETFIHNNTDDLNIEGDSIKLRSHGGEAYIVCTANDEVQLRFNNNVRLQTTSGGVDISGSTDGVLNLDTTDGRGSFIRFKENGTAKGYVGCSEGLGLGDQDDISLRATDRVFIQTGGSSETMRLGRSGSHASIYMNTTSTVAGAMLSVTGNGTCVIGTKVTADNTQPQIRFTNPNGEVGSISTNGSSTSFNTSSDYRLKENAVAISDGITRLKTLKPYRFNFKTDASTTVDGFFAHEVIAVPEAITGTKDEVDSDNNPIYQGIDQSKLVPLLVAAVQELAAKVEALEAA